MRHLLYPATLASALIFGVLGCEQEGVMEETGEEIDQAAEQAGDKLEDATDPGRER